MGIGAADSMICLVLLLADWISRWEDAGIYRAGCSNLAGSLALRLWDKSNNLAHIRSKHLVRERVHYEMTTIILSPI
jgi:hypothetical protein